MSFPAYPDYKQTDMLWVGAMPKHWESQRLKSLFHLVKRPPRDTDGIVTAFRDGQVTLRSNRREDGFTNALQEIGYQGVRSGDLVIHAMDAFAGAVGVSDSDGKSSPVYSVCTPRTGANPRYFSLAIRHMALSGFVNSLAKGVRERSTEFRWADASVQRFPVPPLNEQDQIISFIDRETAKIDTLIEEQRRLIALLKEKRQAVISHAVTKGLDPHAPMKDSGIEWFGEVPAHWASAKVKHACSHVVDCLHTTPTYDGDLLYPAIRTADIERGKLLLRQARLVSEEIYEQRIARLRPIANDVLYSREGERFGLAALVPVGVDLCLGQRMMMFRMLPHASPAYFMWALNSDAVYQQVVSGLGGATSPHINIGDIVNFRIPEPPLSEQRAIADHIATEVAALDDLADVAASAITLLQERRAALISAAVTGKIDVRGSAKVLPFPIDRARARGLVGIEIIERSAGQPTFGRVKFQKVAFLAEGHVGISELAGSYTRAAAGPLDGALIDEMEHGANIIAGIERDQPGGSGTTNSYRLTQPRGAHRQELADWLGPDRTAKLDKLIADFAPLNTKQAEAVATLYGVWNDLLSEDASPSDGEIITCFLNDWHPEKRDKFRASELPEWLGWMRRHGIVPNGSGPKTTTGRLFV